MTPPPVVHDTFVLTRSYPVTPQQVFSAFADVAKKRRWFGEAKQQDVEVFDMDFRVGGAERTRYRMKEGAPFPGVAIATEGFYLDIVPDRRIVMASGMTLGERQISAALLTIELTPHGEGTELTCTHQAAFFEGADGPKMRKEGWESLLGKLADVLSA